MSYTCGVCGLKIRSLERLNECIEAHFQHCRPQCMMCNRPISRRDDLWEVDNFGPSSTVHKDCLDRNLRLPFDHPDRCLFLQWI